MLAFSGVLYIYRFRYMTLFSERYGFVKPREALVREFISIEVRNAICSAYDMLDQALNSVDVKANREYDESYSEMELSIWENYLNQRRNDFYRPNGHKVVATNFVMTESVWYTWFCL